jgi:hypothetical protein
MPEASNSRERSATLLIRVWREPDNPSPFRARLTSVVPGAPPELRTMVTADPERVIVEVRSWIAAVEERPH